MTIVESADITRDPTSHFIQSHPRVHDQRVTVHHWQLRDLVLQRQEPEHKDELIAPVEQDVFRYNTQTGQRQCLIRNLGYHPTCMTTGFGYFAAAGQRSDLTVKDLDGEFEASITTSPSNTINNGLCFWQLNGETRLMVSNNDATIRVFSVPSLQLLHTMEYNIAINHASVSPDGRKMVAVGDDNKVQLHSISSSGYIEKVATMAASKDANFSVSWSSNSEKYAVASQDGSVHIWDIRNRQSMCRLDGVGNPSITKGAARCVKFTQSRAVDLLAFTEHVSHVHIVDARTFDMKQTIRVGPAGLDTPITGLAFSQDSQRMYVGLDKAILEYSVDTASRRRFPQGALL